MDNKKDSARVSPTNRVIDSTDLFRGEKMVLIQHHGDLYRLIVTRQGKLILNK